MTIARTGNRIVDDIARARTRAMAEERRIKAAARKAAGKRKAGGKFRGAGRAGRAAAGRSGKGISAKRLKRQSSASKTAAYGLKDGAELISSNCGYDIPTIAKGLSPKLRPEIKNQIERLTFSMPASAGKATAEQWRARVEFILDQLGIDDSFSYVTSRHTDQDHDHIHIDFNRISDTGELWKDNQIGLRLAALEENVEQKFSLQLTKRENFVTVGNLSKIEIERAQREGVQPVFLQVQSAIHEASRDKPDVLLFISRLADQGIAVRPNLKQGELNGFSYRMGEQSFTGKELGANWMQLKEQVIYDKDEHASALADLKKLVDIGATRPARSAHESTRGVEQVAGAEPSAGDRSEKTETKPFNPDRRAKISPASPRLADRSVNADADADVPDIPVTPAIDPIVQKMRARQALIDKLRTETGDRRELAQNLAQRIERGDLYRQREIVREFLADHKTDPHAADLGKTHLPELVPAAPHRPRAAEPVQELPERLRLADRYQTPTPSESTDYELPTM